MSGHRSDYKNWLKGTGGNCTSRHVLALGDAYIELVEEVEVESKQHLRALEGRYQRENDCVNHCIAGQTKPEYRASARGVATIANYVASPQCKASQKKYLAKPEVKAKLAAKAAVPEQKAFRKAYIEAYNATPERIAINKSPEKRALQAIQNAKPAAIARRIAYALKKKQKLILIKI